MAKSKTTTAVAPSLFTLRVLLADSGAPVKGLFIAFQLAKPDADTKAAKVARIMDVDHAKDLKDKKYQHLLEQYNKEAAENIADPANQFVLGITDIDGYLEPVYDSSNPWRNRFARMEPDTFKFAVGEEYKALYIRHPSPDVARAATKLLNKQPASRADIDFTDAKVWGAGAPALQQFKVEKGSGVDGEQFVIHLPSTPGAYVPLRSDDPSKWWLYAGMPHEAVDSVKEQVEELVTAVSLLKYPATGDQDYPYSVAGVKKTLEWAKTTKKLGEKERENLVTSLQYEFQRFHGPLQGAIGRFQEHVTAREAFKPVDWEQAHVHTSWASEIGSHIQPGKVVLPALEPKGVVGPETAKALKDWAANKWIKPPEHLIIIGNNVLMLARGAFAFNAWSELAKVMGCEYGMSSGHSYRNLLAEGGGGAIKNSIHKTGLASDMTGGRQRTTTNDWPVRFEAEFRRTAATVAEEEEALKQRQKELDDLTKQRDADRATADKELTAANKAKADLIASSQPKAPTKQQMRAVDERIRAANKGITAIGTKYDRPIAKAVKSRDDAQKNLDNARAAAETDSSRLPDRWRMRFRLYGHSTTDVFNPDPKLQAAAMDALRARIAAWAGLPPPKSDQPALADGGISGGFAEFLKSRYFEGVNSPLVDTWIRDQFAPAYEFAKKLLSLTDDEIRAQYFRATVTQWRVNFYERDGGTDSLIPHGPTDGDADFPARANAKSWLNLSAVGHGCLMHRIQPHKWETRDRTSTDYPKKPAKVPPMAFPMDQYLRFESAKAEAGDIVAAIEDITASSAQAPELAQGDFLIEFHEPTGKNKETTVDETALPREIDGPFFKEWRRKISKIEAPAYKPGTKSAFQPKGAQISLVLNELNPDRQDALHAALNLFRSDFKTKNFVVMQSGPLVDDELVKEKMFTGAELAAAADTALARLTAEATATAKAAAAAAATAAAADGPAAKAARGKKPKQVKKKDLPKPPKANIEDWSILVQPVFANEVKKGKDLFFLPEHIVMLPARENAAHLEWWHFQHHSVLKAGTWGALLEECGFSIDVLGTPAEGALDASGEPVHMGLGYTNGPKGELKSSPWPPEKEILAGPTNSDSLKDEAVEEDLVYIE